jgi:ribosomal small subunit protein bTHX
MGKGDKKTAKGKRIMGTYGNTRKRKVSRPTEVTTKKSKSVDEKPEVSKEAPAKKTVAKKTTTKKSSSKSSEAKEK